MTEHIEVYLGSGDALTLVGTAIFVARGGRVSTTFTYAPRYLASPSAYAIDPALPLTAGAHHVRDLPGAFGDSAPDRWGRNLIKARLQAESSREILEYDYLLGVGDLSRQGALRFRRQTGQDFLSADHAVPRLVDLPRLLRASDNVARNGAARELAATKELLEAGTGTLGGARPKASVVGDNDELFIAKFPKPSDEWDVMAWEATTLDLAADAGISVPQHRLLKVDGRSVLLLARFDRDGSARHGYASALTMLSLADGERADYVDIADVILDESSHLAQDLEQLWRRIAFSIAVHNTDDHMRNHGFLHVRGAWRLSPAFDLNPNPDSNEGRTTTIDGERLGPDEVDGLMRLAPAFRLTDSRAREIAAEVEGAVDGWREAAGKNGCSPREVDLMRSAFSTKLSR